MKNEKASYQAVDSIYPVKCTSETLAELNTLKLCGELTGRDLDSELLEAVINYK